MHIWIAALFTGLGLVTAGYGNNGSVDHYPVTGQVMMVKNKSVDMIWEIVTYEKWKFTAVFCFSNTTEKEQKVKMGFPIKSLWELEEDSGELPIEWKYKDVYGYISGEIDFKAFDNGNPVKVELVDLLENKELVKNAEKYPIDFIYISDVVFRPGEVKIISNSYNQKPVIRTSGGILGDFTLEYILKTGATWKSPIGHSIIKFVLDIPMYGLDGYYFPTEFAKASIEVTPKPLKITHTNGTAIIEWDYKNFTPSKDIKVEWRYKPILHSIFYYVERMIAENNPYLMFSFDYENNIDNGQALKDFQNIYNFERFVQLIENILLKQDDFENGGWLVSSGNGEIYRFLINCKMALKGYKFKKTFWQKYFAQFKWYKPETDEPVFSEEEKKVIDILVKKGQELQTVINNEKTVQDTGNEIKGNIEKAILEMFKND